MFRFPILLLLLLFCGVNRLYAQSADTKIVIADKEELYTYALNKKGEIEVQVDYTTRYQCLKPGSVSFADFYDSYTEIKEVKVRGVKGVTPKYGMFKQENIFFSDEKACYFNIPFLKRGEEATVSVRKIYRDVRRLNMITLAEFNFIRSKTIRLRVPDWMQVTILLKNGSERVSERSERDEKAQVTTYIFQILDQEEVVTEVNSTGYEHTYPYLIIVPETSVVKGESKRYFGTVNDLYQWYREPLLTLRSYEESVRIKSAELTAGCKSEGEQIRELCKWVQRNIRYVAFRDGISAYRPDDAGEVLLKRYGDCKGMSNLLKAMLVSAGFDARLTWVATRSGNGNDLDPEAPVPFADHMICSLFLNDSLYYIDPTVKSLSFGEIPEVIQGRKALIEEGEKYLIRTIPDFGPKCNLDSLFIRYTLDGERLTGNGEHYFRGESKHTIVYWLNSLKEKEKVEKIEKFLKGNETQDSLSNIRAEGLDDFLPEISVYYTANRKSNIKKNDRQIYIHPDVRKDYQNAKIDIASRKTDMELPFKDFVVRVTEWVIPDGYHVKQLPEETDIVRENYRFSLSFREEEDKIVYRKELAFFHTILEKAAFEEWNSDIDRLRKAYSELIVLERPESQP